MLPNLEYTHKELVSIASSWLWRNHSVVITEMASVGYEEPDAIGFDGVSTTLVECKATRQDFLSDRNKEWRQPHAENNALGTHRYYLVPAGMVAPEEVPETWGLLYATPKRVKCLRKAEAFPGKTDYKREMLLLTSAIRRIGQTRPVGVSVKCYTIETKNTATIGIQPEEEK